MPYATIELVLTTVRGPGCSPAPYALHLEGGPKVSNVRGGAEIGHAFGHEDA